MRRALMVCGLISIAACQLAPLDVEGLRCLGDEECEGRFCVSGVCSAKREEVDAGIDAGLDAGQPDAGIPLNINLLANPGFETLLADGGLEAWRSSNAKLVTEQLLIRSGLRSAQLTAGTGTGSASVLPTKRVTGIGAGMAFCAGIYVRTDRTAGMDVTLSLRNYLSDGTINVISGSRTSIGTTWTQLTKAVPTFAGSELEMRVSVNGQDAGMNLYLDDATMLRTDDNGCL